jgi:hypothetical protein
MTMRILSAVGLIVVVSLSFGARGCMTVPTTYTYLDSVSDVYAGLPATFDIVDVTLSNDDSNLTITVKVNGALAQGDASNSENYFILFDTVAGGSATPPLSRAMNLTVEHDYFIGTWPTWPAVSGGSMMFRWNGSAWVELATKPTMDISDRANGRITYTIPLSSLGLGSGDTFTFDVVSTGDGESDPGFDHLSNVLIATPDATTASNAGEYISHTVE